MARRYAYACNLSWGGDTPTAELDDVEVTFSVAWGDPSEVEDIRVERIDGRPAADYLRGDYFPGCGMAAIVDKLEMDHEDRMLDAASQEEAERRADDLDRRDEARAERLRESF